MTNQPGMPGMPAACSGNVWRLVSGRFITSSSRRNWPRWTSSTPPVVSTAASSPGTPVPAHAGPAAAGRLARLAGRMHKSQRRLAVLRLAVNACHCAAPNRKTGPSCSFVSRTAMPPSGIRAHSTHCPFADEKLLVNQLKSSIGPSLPTVPDGGDQSRAICRAERAGPQVVKHALVPAYVLVGFKEDIPGERVDVDQLGVKLVVEFHVDERAGHARMRAAVKGDELERDVRPGH